MPTRSPWQHPARLDAEVAIVGGGVTGLATAHAIEQLQPGTRVVVLEADRLAFGASGRNAGFLLLGTHADYASAVEAYGHARARAIWAFTHDAYRAVADLAGRADIGFRATGSVLAAGSLAEARRLRASRDVLARDGIASEWVEAAEPFGVSGFDGALFVPDGGVVDPVRLVHALGRESRAQVVTGWRCQHIEPEGGRVRLGSALGTVTADRVLVATNAWLPDLVPETRGAVRPVRAQMLMTAPCPPALSAPVYSHDGYFYVRQRADGRVLLGGARHLHRDAEVGLVDATTPELQADLEAYLAQHVPSLAGARVERRWSGPMGFSPDGLPRLGAVAGVPGAWWAGGFTGHGMGYGLRFGRLAARRLLGLSDPAADLFGALGESALAETRTEPTPAFHRPLTL